MNLDALALWRFPFSFLRASLHRSLARGQQLYFSGKVLLISRTGFRLVHLTPAFSTFARIRKLRAVAETRRGLKENASRGWCAQESGVGSVGSGRGAVRSAAAAIGRCQSRRCAKRGVGA